jgi:dihydrofolate reductase
VVRRLVASEFISLDGVMEDPSWTFQFGSEEQEQYKFEELFASDALLLGRVTYEGFASAWPRMMEQYEGPRRAALEKFTDRMNNLAKYVVSTTLEDPLEWNNSTMIKGDVAEAVADLKQQPGQDILIGGSGDLVNTLMGHDLIDEYRLMVFPVVVGGGKRLFREGSATRTLKLIATRTFGSGVVVLTYGSARDEYRREGG